MNNRDRLRYLWGGVKLGSVLVLAVVVLTMVLGCASKPLTEDEIYEREQRRAETRDHWARCRASAKRHHRVWISYENTLRGYHRHTQELLSNRCRRTSK